MSTWQHLAVAIANPMSDKQTAIRKATEIAQRCKARVTLYHAFSLPYPLSNPEPTNGKEAITAAKHSLLAELQKLSKPLLEKGINVSCVVEWDFPIDEAIIGFVVKHKPDILIADSHHHSRVGRWLFANIDWELIKGCPCPIWFVKSDRSAIDMPLLAAINPFDTLGRNSQIDDQVITVANSVLTNTGGYLKVVHSYQAPLSTDESNLIEPFRLPIASKRRRSYISRIKSGMDDFALSHGIKSEDCFIEEGEPTEVICDVVEKTNTGLLVLGTVNQRQHELTFISHLAEKLIDKVDCDLLIIKPPGFSVGVGHQCAETLIHI